MQRRLLSVVLLAVVGACSQPVPAPQQPAPEREQPAIALTQRCRNTQDGFSVSYPAGWKTNDGSVLPACSVFDPAPIELPRESEIPFELAIVIGAEDAPFEPQVRSSQFERVLSSERLKIAGKDAVRVEAEATGEGLADRGMRSLRYVLDLGNGRTLVATTSDTGSYAEEKEILARMVETLSFP